MKTKIIYTALTLFTFIFSYGQSVEFNTALLEYEDEKVESITVITKPQIEELESKFENWMDEAYDVNLDGKKLLFFSKEFLTANGVVIPKISDKKIDLIVKVDNSNKDLTKLNVISSYGYNNWITPQDNPAEFLAMQDILFEFVNDYLPEYYMEKIAKSKEMLKDLNETRNDLNDELTDNVEDIDKLHQENGELYEKLKKNQERINQAKQNIKKRNKELEKIKSEVEDKPQINNK